MPLKFGLRMLNFAAPVSTRMAENPSLAKFGPPKFPEPVVKVADAVPPAARLGAIPQASIHLALPEGHVPRIRNWPALAPVNVTEFGLDTPAESATGTPMQNGSSVRATPAMLPGYKASCSVSGIFNAPP